MTTQEELRNELIKALEESGVVLPPLSQKEEREPEPGEVILYEENLLRLLGWGAQ